MSSLTYILRFLKPYKRDVAISMVFLTIAVGLDLSVPRLVQTIIDQGITARNMQAILDNSIFMIIASLLSAVMTVVNTIYSVRASQNFAADIRKALYHKIQSLSFGNLDDFQTGRLLVRLTSDINKLQMVVQISLRMLVRAPLMGIGSVFLMLIINQQLARLMLALLFVTFVFTLIFVVYARPMFMGIQRRLDNLNQILQENLAGIRIVKAFVRRDHEAESFDKANVDLTRQSSKVEGLISILLPLMLLAINLGTVAVIYFGGLQVIEGTFTVGEVTAFISYLLTTMFPIAFLAMMAGQVSAANASADRIKEIFDTTPQISDKPNAIPLQQIKGRVSFEDVCFSYNKNGEEMVLNNINLVAEPGQNVAILGATGSGKSSLVNLIPRFYDATKGRVTIDRIDVKDVRQDSLRTQIGMILQEALLFSGTIRDNIKYGRHEATDEKVIAAAKAAQAHEFIMSCPQGYDTLIGQRGANLSGGQKQRIAIARALLIDPKILILDDSTSSVDLETETKIQEALRELMKDRTSFVIAQRISTVLNADKIVVLNSGNMVAEGTHFELMRTSPLYREIYESQLGNGGP